MSSKLESKKKEHVDPDIWTIGLVGGIGSGKSYVARILSERFDVPVYDSDTQAKRLYDVDEELKREMISLLGKRLYDTESGCLDRTFLGQRIFSDRALLAEVNALVHPAVRRDFLRWRGRLVSRGVQKCALESALLLDSGLDEYVDAVVAVSAPLEVRIARTMQRDGVGREAIEARLQHQMPEATLLERADYILHNDSQHDLKAEICAMLGQD